MPQLKNEGRSWLRALIPLLVFAGVIVLWQGVYLLGVYPKFIIPSPVDVLTKFIEVVADGSLWEHASATIAATISGLFFGALVGVVLGYFIAKQRWLEELLSPLVVTLQSTPVVAYAPLLVIWFGSGLTSKIITSSLIVFFPLLMNTIVAVRQTPPSLRDMMRSMGATRWQVLTKLELPAALPVLFSGLKVSATLAVIGAVVGEFVNANVGLGKYITIARGQYDTALVLVIVFTLAFIARALYGLVAALEWETLRWQRRSRR